MRRDDVSARKVIANAADKRSKVEKTRTQKKINDGSNRDYLY